MSEKQLTVAELMERAAKEGRVEAPRRRRRSLEEGGVSVAELTGSIPVVKAVPADSRHSAEPIDAPFQPKRAPSPPQDEETVVKKPAEPEPEPSEVDDDTPPWLTESVDTPSGSFTAVDPTPTPAPALAPTPSPAPAPEPEEEEDDTPPWLLDSHPPSSSFTAVTAEEEEEETPPWLTATEPEAEEEPLPPWLTPANDVVPPAEEEEDTPPWLIAAEEEAKKEPEEVPPWIITEEEEEEEATPPWMLPEDQESAEEDTPPWLQQHEEEQQQQQQQQAEPASTPSTDKTMVISVVNENDPVRLTTGAFEAITPDQAQAAAAAASPQTQETTQMSAVPDADVAEDHGEIQRPDIAAVIPMGGQAPRTDRRNARTKLTPQGGPIPGPAPSTTETQVQPVVDTPIPDPQGNTQARPLPVKREPNENEKEGKVSFLAIIGMTLLAIVVGVALFLGFEMLWRSFAKWIVALLALAVTGGIVGVVHALRTERDFLSMGLAGLAGLAMTFGPMAVAGL